VNQKRSQKTWFEIAGVSDVAKYLLTNHVNHQSTPIEYECLLLTTGGL